jgi:hypothetical protein
MKDIVRLPSSLRRRIEELARREGRSLSQQVGRLIEQGIGPPAGPSRAAPRRKTQPLSGLFAEDRVPRLTDFQRVRASISDSLSRRGGRRGSIPR